MTQVFLEIPEDKIKPFLQSIVNLGLDKHTITSKVGNSKSFKKLIKFPSRILVPNWEFFSNELEYE